MSMRDFFVAGVALTIALFALASAFRFPTMGLNERAYRLRSIRAVEDRWGEWAARLLLLVIATIMFVMGAAIVAQGHPINGGSPNLSKSNRR